MMRLTRKGDGAGHGHRQSDRGESHERATVDRAADGRRQGCRRTQREKARPVRQGGSGQGRGCRGLRRARPASAQALAPEGGLEEALCARIVGCLWRLRRIVRLESAMVGDEDGMRLASLLERGWLCDEESECLQLFSQYETRLDRILHRALHELQRLQARRGGAHVPPPLVLDVEVRGLSSLEDPPEPMPARSLRR
jgi:hypothetical protein